MPNSEIDIEAIRQRAEAATPGPWWDDSDENCWRLHGVHGRIPVTLGGVTIDQVMNHQIIKAPKRNTPYAEYWPNEADAAFIRHAREDIPALLAEINRLRRMPVIHHAPEGTPDLCYCDGAPRHIRGDNCLPDPVTRPLPASPSGGEV